MVPLAECFYDGKKFLVVGIVPLFSCLELSRVECYGVPIMQLAWWNSATPRRWWCWVPFLMLDETQLSPECDSTECSSYWWHDKTWLSSGCDAAECSSCQWCDKTQLSSDCGNAGSHFWWLDKTRLSPDWNRISAITHFNMSVWRRIGLAGLKWIKTGGSVNMSFRASNASHTVGGKLKGPSFFPCFAPPSRLVRGVVMLVYLWMNWWK